MEIYTDTIIEKTLFIAHDEELIIKDCTIRIASDAHIVCMGKFEAKNVCFEPIKDTFGAIAIMSYNKESTISECTFRRGGGIALKYFKDFPIFLEIFPLEDWEYAQEEASSHLFLESKIAGAIFCVDTAINLCLFEECQSEDDGGSLYAIRSTIKNSKFINSYSKGDCGAICGMGSTVTRCSFVDCQAGDSGGAIGRKDVGIENCLFLRCHAINFGGAIFGSEQKFIHNCKFINCTANHGGAIDDAVNVSHCTFKNCSALHAGGAITTNTRIAFIRNSKFINCHAQDKNASSDAIGNCLSGTIIMDCVFKNSQKSCQEFIYGCSYTLINAHFTSNYILSSPTGGCCNMKIMSCSYNHSQIKS